MAKATLTDMQRILLSNASMRLNRRILPVPKSLQKGASAIALSIKPLIARGLVSEVAAARQDVIWREDAQHGELALAITTAGMEAIGLYGEEADPATLHNDGLGGDDDNTGTARSAAAPGTSDATKGPPLPRDGTKLALLIATLLQPLGATIPDVMEVTGWQAHSIRGAMSGALKKKLGLSIVSELIEGRGRVYRLVKKEPETQHVDGVPTDAGAALTLMKRLTAQDVEREIAALDGLDTKALQHRWRELYKIEPPLTRSGFLRRAIAYRLQEIVYGGLKPQTRRALRRIAADLRAKRAKTEGALVTGEATRSPSRMPILSPGTRLLREWNGTMQSVDVVDAGFVWRDTTYRTLSAVAVAITGTKWSGPKFFGLLATPRLAASKKVTSPFIIADGAP